MAEKNVLNADQIKKEIQKQATVQAAKWFIALVILLISFAVSGWWFYLEDRITAMTGGVPKGAVVPFFDVECKDGWDDYKKGNGKVIVGVGQGKDENGNDLSNRRLEEEGGLEDVMLLEGHIPSHSHQIPSFPLAGSQETTYALKATGKGDFTTAKRRTDNYGGREAHENMPPFIVLRYCIKI